MEINTNENLSQVMGWDLADPSKPHIKYFPDMIQGTEEWFAARCGLLTASEVKNIMTESTMKLSGLKKDGTYKPSSHFWELLAQRISNFVEPQYVSEDMLRGGADETEARAIYVKENPDAYTVGFVTNSRWGFTLGYSPDGLVGDHGAIECKSRKQKFQIETILNDECPSEFMIQVQTGLLVTERDWCDFITYSGGLPMMIKRVYPNPEIQEAIIEAATIFHQHLDVAYESYQRRLKQPDARLYPTERKVEQEMYV